MLIKSLTLGIAGLFAISSATCDKSAPQDASKDASKDAPAPEVVLEGVDTGSLTPREKREWGQYVSELVSPCQSVPVPIAQCIREKRACSRCLPAAKYLLKQVKEGRTREQIDKIYKGRFDADKVKNIPLDGSPSTGPESAPVTIVEFADFECPACGAAFPVLDKLVESHKNDVRFVYKFYPLPSHPHADPAARAGISAWKQGKFWEMHHKLFANQRHLEQTDLDSYAKELGLDVGRLHAEMQSNETTDRISRDRKMGEDVGIGGTPAIYINGRQFEGGEDLEDYVALELQMVKEGGVVPPASVDGGAKAVDGGTKPAPSGSSSAKPAASAAAPRKN